MRKKSIATKVTAAHQFATVRVVHTVAMTSHRSSHRLSLESMAATISDTIATWITADVTTSDTTDSGPRNGVIRWYDPITGRWLSKDPIGISGGLNQYVFCGSSPINCIDPSGLKWGTIDPKLRPLTREVADLLDGASMAQKIKDAEMYVDIDASPDKTAHWVQKGGRMAIQIPVDNATLFILGHEMQHALETLYPNSFDPADLSVDADSCPDSEKSDGKHKEFRANRAGNRLEGEYSIRHWGKLSRGVDWYHHSGTGERYDGIPHPFGTRPILGRPVP